MRQRITRPLSKRGISLSLYDVIVGLAIAVGVIFIFGLLYFTVLGPLYKLSTERGHCQLFALSESSGIRLFKNKICPMGTGTISGDENEAKAMVLSYVKECFLRTNSGQLREDCRPCYEFEASESAQKIPKLEGMAKALQTFTIPETGRTYAQDLPNVRVEFDDVEGSSLVPVDYIVTANRYRILYSNCGGRIKFTVIPTKFYEDTKYVGTSQGICSC